MPKITENDIELLCIEELEKLGWSYVYGMDIAPDGQFAERKSYSEIVLIERLRSALTRINPSLSSSAVEEAVKQVLRISSPSLITNNEEFHKLLTDGIKLEVKKDGEVRGVNSDKVIDIFDAAGIKKPDISILSDDFLAEIKGMEHKNLVLEVLRKLLNDEIKIRAKKNLIQSRVIDGNA